MKTYHHACWLCNCPTEMPAEMTTYVKGRGTEISTIVYVCLDCYDAVALPPVTTNHSSIYHVRPLVALISLIILLALLATSLR
jgi:hypothetical protein